MNETDVIRALAALAQEVRLRLFRALVEAGRTGLTPGVMSEQLQVAGNSLSFHLKELVYAGLVSQERQGRHLIYRANFTSMSQLMAYLTQNCCQGEVCEVALDAICDC